MSDPDERSDRMQDRLSSRFKTGASDDKEDVEDTNSVDDDVDVNDVVEVDDNVDADEDMSAGQTVRDTTGRTFYVGEETLQKLDSLYKEFEFRYYQKYGENLPKNKQFYPALFDVVVEHPELVAEKLGLEGDEE